MFAPRGSAGVLPFPPEDSMAKRPVHLPTLPQLLAPYRRQELDRTPGACGTRAARQLLAAWSPAWCAWTP